MAYSDPGAVTGGSTPARATWANAVRDDLVDHESRISSVEAGTTSIAIAAATLTDAQIKALPTTPVTIVAAPGAGYRIRVLTCSLSAHGLSVHPYTGLDPDYNSLQVQSSTGNWAGFIADDASQDPALSQVSHFIGAVFPQDLVVDLQVPTLQGFTSASGSPLVVSAKKEWVVSNDAAFPGGTRASWDNTAIAIAMDNNGSGNLGGGNASNTIRVTVYYAIEAL